MRVPDELLEQLRSPGEEGRFADRFLIEREAGVGGMGIVYRAVDAASGEPVALKVLRAGDGPALERFAAEAEALDGIDHPAVVRPIAHGVSRDGEPFLAMEWIDGQSLSARLAGGALAIDDTIALGGRVAGALAALHARGILHRDIKPSNILLPGGRPSEAKVCDLGVARAVTPRACEWTGAGIVVGTPGYMAPEQARGRRDLDGRADLFALGCVLFRCLTDSGAFDGSIALTALAKLVLLDPPRVAELRPEVPPALDDLVARLLAKERDDRPPGAAWVRAELERIAGAAGPAPQPRARPRAARVGAGGRFGRYRVDQRIAAGGGGELYSAWDTALHRRVTLKLPRRPDAGNQELVREGRIAAGLDHPGIVAVHDLGEQDGVAYLAMEHVSGQTLRARAGARRQRLDWLVQLARALAAAHEAGVVHGDVKPENAIVTDAGRLVLLDFGVAQTSGAAGEPIAGTPGYVAPERLRGDPVDGRADQFAWGVIACELMTGRLPWSGGDPLSILAAVLFEEPRVTGLPATLCAVVRRALRKWPEDRFPTMSHLLRALSPSRRRLPCRREIYDRHLMDRSRFTYGTEGLGRALSLYSTTNLKTGESHEEDRQVREEDEAREGARHQEREEPDDLLLRG